MSLFKHRLLIAIIVCGASFINQNSFAKIPSPEIETLSNGMKVVWFNDDRLPIIDFNLIVPGGTSQDPPGKSGMATLLSSLFDRGAGGLSAQEYAKAADMLGAEHTSAVSEDNFSISFHGLATDAATLLDLLAKAATAPNLADAEIERERDRIMDYWKRIADNSAPLANLIWERIVTADTVYGRGSLNGLSELKQIKPEDVRTFYRSQFNPAQAVLLVVGQTNKKTLAPRIRATFGEWKNKTTPDKNKKLRWNPFVKLKQKKGQIVIIDRPELTQAHVLMGFRSPLFNSPDHFELVLANTIIGEYFNSRLNSIIRDKLGLTYAIGSGFEYSQQLGRFKISSATRNETVGQLVQRTQMILEDLQRNGVTEDEVRTAKEYSSGRFPIDVSSIHAVAGSWISTQILGSEPDYLERFLPSIASLSTTKINEALKRNLDLKNIVIVIAGDAKAITKSLKETGISTSKTIKAVDLL